MEVEEAKKQYEEVMVAQNLDTGRWIMVTVQLPPMEFNPPPPISIHWSVPWPMDAKMCLQNFLTEDIWGKSGNPLTARKVVFNEHEFRLFDCEFSFLSAQNMEHFVLGLENEPPSHMLRPARGLAEKILIADVVDGERKPIYEAALLDGATEAQAFQTAMEVDVLGGVQFPPVGWYECKEEYLRTFFPKLTVEPLKQRKIKEKT
jgi:hypothetical protein